MRTMITAPMAIALLLTFLLSQLQLSLAASFQLDPSWSSRGKDPTRQATNEFAGSISPVNVTRYAFQGPSQPSSTDPSSSDTVDLAVTMSANGTVFAPLNDTVVALASGSGTQLWNYTCTGGGHVLAAPSLVSIPTGVPGENLDVVVVACADGNVALLSQATGAVQGSVASVGFPVVATPLVTTLIDGSTPVVKAVLAGSSGGAKVAQLTGGGVIVPSATVPLPAVIASPVLALDGQLAVVVAEGGVATTINMLTGAKVNQTTLFDGVDVSATPAVLEDSATSTTLVVVTDTGGVWLVTVTPNSITAATSPCHQLPGLPKGSPAANASGLVVVTDSDSGATGLLVVGGACVKLWQAPLLGARSAALDGNGNTVVGTSTGLVALDLLGQQLWNLTVFEHFHAPAVGPYGEVAAVSTSPFGGYRVHMLSLTSSRALFDLREAQMLAYANETAEAVALVEQYCDVSDNLAVLLEEPQLYERAFNCCQLAHNLEAGLLPGGAVRHFVQPQAWDVVGETINNGVSALLVPAEEVLQGMVSAQANLSRLLALTEQAQTNNQKHLDEALARLEDAEASLAILAGAIVKSRLKMAEIMTEMAIPFDLWYGKLNISIKLLEAAIAAGDIETIVLEGEAALDAFTVTISGGASVLGGLVKAHFSVTITDLQEAFWKLGQAMNVLQEETELHEAYEKLQAAWTDAQLMNQTAVALIQANQAINLINASASSLPKLLDAFAADRVAISTLQNLLAGMVQAIANEGGGEIVVLAQQYAAWSLQHLEEVQSWFEQAQQVQQAAATVQALQVRAKLLEEQAQQQQWEQAFAWQGVQMAHDHVRVMQLALLRLAAEACQQYEYFALKPCPVWVASPLNPSGSDFTSFVSTLATDAKATLAQMNAQVHTCQWVRYRVKLSAAQKQALAQSGQLDVFVPPPRQGSLANGTISPRLTPQYNVRMLDFGVRFEPANIVGEGEIAGFELQKWGRSEFWDASQQWHSFTHPEFDDNQLFLNSSGCFIGSNSQPQCSGTVACSSYINYSPYGPWRVVTDLDASQVSNVTALDLYFQVFFDKAENPFPPLLWFGNNNDTQFPAPDCCQCQQQAQCTNIQQVDMRGNRWQWIMNDAAQAVVRSETTSDDE